MSNKLKLLFVAGGAVIIGLVIWGIYTTGQLNAAHTELASTRTQLLATEDKLTAANNELAATKTTLAATEDELTDTKTKLTATASQLTTTQNDLAEKTSELNASRVQLAGVNSELSSANTKLNSAQQSVATLQNTLAQTQTQLNLSQKTLTGLGITLNSSAECADVVLVDNPKAVDPTLNQVLTFLAQDKTENHPYVLNVYDCSQFSRDLHNNAEAAGIRTAEVQIWFTNSDTGHALDAFLTTDYGLVYVDDTDTPDSFARVKLLKAYKGLEVQNVPTANLRNDAWWDSLHSYYFINVGGGTQAVVQSIDFFW